MKKILSMALIAFMIGLAAVGCKKENATPEPEPDPVTPDPEQPTDTIKVNPIMDAFNLGKDLLGKTHNEVINTLVNKGYYNNSGFYMYKGESYMVQMVDSVNKEGKVFNLSLTVTPYDDGVGVYKPMLTMQYAYDAIKKIGQNFNMGTRSLRYWGTYNQVGTRMASSYEEFVKYINAGNFDKNNSIWLDSTIPHYDATNWNSFIGLQLHSSKYQIQGCDETEFSFPINFIDNSLKD